MKLVHVTLFHLRPEMSDLWLNHMRGRDVAACVTEGDRDNIALLKRYGVPFIEHRNQPLGKKANAALQFARTFDADAYVIHPCDDFIGAPFLVTCEAALKSGHDYIVPARCAMHEPWTNRSCILDQRHGVLGCGSGRIFSRAVVERIGDLWPDHIHKGLDYRSHIRVTGHGFQPLYLDYVLCPIVDVKCSRNIWPFDHWVKRGKHAKADDVLWMLSDAERATVRTFKGS